MTDRPVTRRDYMVALACQVEERVNGDGQDEAILALHFEIANDPKRMAEVWDKLGPWVLSQAIRLTFLPTKLRARNDFGAPDLPANWGSSYRDKLTSGEFDPMDLPIATGKGRKPIGDWDLEDCAAWRERYEKQVNTMQYHLAGFAEVEKRLRAGETIRTAKKLRQKDRAFVLEYVGWSNGHGKEKTA